MLIEVDNWTKDVLWNTSDYIVRPSFKVVDHKAYIKVDDLVQAIADLTDEIERQFEVIEQLDKGIQVYFKGTQSLTLTEIDVKYLKDAEDLTDTDFEIRENTITKESLLCVIQELVRQNKKQWEEIRELKEDIRELR